MPQDGYSEITLSTAGPVANRSTPAGVQRLTLSRLMPWSEEPGSAPRRFSFSVKTKPLEST